MGFELTSRLTGMSFEISVKSEVVSNSLVAQKMIQLQFGQLGIHVGAPVAAEDLGIGIGARGRRTSATMTKRILKCEARSRRAGVLVRHIKKARTLWKTGSKPMIYAPYVSGMAPTQRGRVRAAAMACLGAPGVAPCTVTTFQWLAPEDDPELDIPLQQVTKWLQLWPTLTPERKTATRKSWRKHLARLQALPPHRRWRAVTGPAAATICVLLDASWDPYLPNVWGAPGGAKQAIVSADPWSRVTIREAFRESWLAHLWRKAASHHAGGGGWSTDSPTWTSRERSRGTSSRPNGSTRLEWWTS